MCVRAGTTSSAINLMTQVLIKSIPVDFVFLSPAIISLISLGVTGLKVNVHSLFLTTSLSFSRGSESDAGILA